MTKIGLWAEDIEGTPSPRAHQSPQSGSGFFLMVGFVDGDGLTEELGIPCVPVVVVGFEVGAAVEEGAVCGFGAEGAAVLVAAADAVLVGAAFALSEPEAELSGGSAERGASGGTALEPLDAGPCPAFDLGSVASSDEPMASATAKSAATPPRASPPTSNRVRPLCGASSGGSKLFEELAMEGPVLPDGV